MLQEHKKLTVTLLCGLLGCLCFGAGDWLMIYGDTAHGGSLSWLTDGTAQIPPWRNGLPMALTFPGIIFYGIAWMALSNPLVIYGALKPLTLLMPDVPLRLAFTNGLMSESMALWFGSMLVLLLRSKRLESVNKKGQRNNE